MGRKMKKQRLEFPESTDEYREGIEARDRGERLQDCPTDCTCSMSGHFGSQDTTTETWA